MEQEKYETYIEKLLTASIGLGTDEEEEPQPLYFTFRVEESSTGESIESALITTEEGRILTHLEFERLFQYCRAFYQYNTARMVELLNKELAYKSWRQQQEQLALKAIGYPDRAEQPKLPGWVALFRQKDSGYYRLAFTKYPRGWERLQNFTPECDLAAWTARIQNESIEPVELIQHWHGEKVAATVKNILKELDHTRVNPSVGWLRLNQENLDFIYASLGMSLVS